MLKTNCSNTNMANIQNALLQTKFILADWLINKLSAINPDYWNDLVLPKLSYYQNLMIERNHINNLQQLDLTCILRIFDKNWFDLSFKYGFKPQIRSYVKSLQIIRNKYAHAACVIPLKEVNDDISIISSLLSALNLASNLQDELLSMKSSEDIEKETSSDNVEMPAPYILDAGAIKVNDIVCIKALQNKTGIVTNISGDEYFVFVDGEIKTFYGAQISKLIKEEEPFIPLSSIRNYLSSYIIRHPTTSSLYSLNAARINLIPYQFKPVVKIIKADQPRLLIADSVGIGKTIEAGLILRELQIRNNVKSVLIICPKPLVSEKKWEQEMKRFDEDFEALDSAKLKYCVNECNMEGEWPEKYQKIILPYSLFDNDCLKILDQLKPFPKFDLVIVDEAHHIRNQSAIRHQVVKKFCDTAEAVVFLTATPIQLGNEDLYSLLNLLRPDIIVDEETFNTLHAPNKYITQAVQNIRNKNLAGAIENLHSAANSVGGKFVSERPDFNESLQILQKQDLTKEELVELVDKVSQLHTFNFLINRTLRKEIATDFCIRQPETVRTQMTEEEASIFNELRILKADMLQKFAGINNVNFVMTTLERQAASCIHGLVPLIKDILNKTLTINSFDNLDDDTDIVTVNFDNNVLKNYQQRIDKLVEEANNLSDEDPKFEAFFRVINEKQNLENKKVIVFSTFRHTLEYLYNKLRKNNIRVGLIHGGINDEERLVIREKFEKSSHETDALDVLLFSEVGCEGLDYQFCDTMINYDLPWNPMKIEQRIGRIDRFGQKSEAVAIYNMIVDNTIDAHIYDRCLNRIKIFEESIGDCDEILGEIHNEIREVCLSTSLSDEQKQKKLERIGENKYLNILQQRQLEQQQVALFSIPSKLSSIEEFESFENYWVSPLALEHLVSAYLRKKVSHSFSGNGAKRTLRLSEEDRNILFEDYLKIPTRKGRIYKDWEKYLKGKDQHCSLTFEIEQASKDRNLQFIMPLHPLVIMAAMEFKAQMPIRTALQIVDNNIPEGEYPFIVYSWEYTGNRPSIKLKTICENETISQNILTFLETGAELSKDSVHKYPSNELKDIIHTNWNEEVDQYKNRVEQQINYQINSLKVSSEARKNSARKNNLIQIRENLIEKIEAETTEKINRLQEQSQLADILQKQILSGVIKIIHEGEN